jgi:hypothetical protein
MAAIHIFDMRKATEVAALRQVLELTPVQRAEQVAKVASTKLQSFISQNLTLAQALAFWERMEVPAGLTLPVSKKLAELASDVRRAQADLKATKAGAVPPFAMAAE